MDKDINENYYVKDLYEACYLYLTGIPLKGLLKDSTRFYFVFSEKSTCIQLRDKYWAYETAVDAKKYADAIKSLKDRIFSEGAKRG